MKKCIFLILVFLGLFNSCQKEESKSSEQLFRTSELEHAETQVQQFFLDLNGRLSSRETNSTYEIAAKMRALGYEVSNLNSGAMVVPMNIGMTIDLDNLNFEALAIKLQMKKQELKSDYINSGSIASQKGFLEIIGLMEMINLYQNRPDLYGRSATLRGASNECKAAVTGAFIAGGLGGCKEGAKIGSFFGPQNILTGCVFGGFIGAVGGSLLAASQYCK